MARLRHGQGFRLTRQLGFQAGGAVAVLRFAGVVALVVAALAVVLVALATLVAVAAVLLRLVLLLHGGHGAQDAEVMLRMLEIALGAHAITATGRIAAELEVFLEKLLGRSAQPDIRAAGIKDMVAVERLIAPVSAPTAACGAKLPAAAAIATTAAMAMATAHALHVHSCLCFCCLVLPRRSHVSTLAWISSGAAPLRGCTHRPALGPR